MDNENVKRDFTEEVELLKPALEAMVFASEVPVTIDQLAEIFVNISKETIKSALFELKEEYAHKSRGIVLLEIAGGYHFRTKPEYRENIAGLVRVKPSKLSQSALETLAIIAYKQPIIKAEIEDIRGVDSGYVIKSLLQKKLIKIVGKKNIVGKPLVYGTTKEFLEVFSLKDLSSLPSLKNIKELDAGGEDDSQLSLL